MSCRPSGIPLGPWPIALAVVLAVGFLALAYGVLPALEFLMDHGERLIRERLATPR